MLRRTGLVLSIVLVAIVTGMAEEAAKEAKKEKAVTAEQLKPKTGTWWYAMSSSDGPCGYAWLEVREAEDGVIAIAWELKLAFSGGEYEEARTMLLDGNRRILAASVASPGRPVVAGKRIAVGKWEVTTTKPGEDATVAEMDLPDDTLTGLGFVLASWMPQEAGLALLRADVNEAAGFRREGSVVIRGVGREPLPGDDAKTEDFRFDLTRRDGRTMPIHVNAEREIRRIDWQGGMVMTLRRESTKHLFKKTPPAVAEVPSGPEKLVVRGEYPKTDPAAMFALWTNEVEIVRWWPRKAEIEPKVGGKYLLSWPGANWFLKGRITVYEKDKRMGFTWKWHHEREDAPKREVLVEFAAREGGGSVLTITHGPYTTAAKDQEERKGHLAGWSQFCTKLKALEK